MAGIYVHIPFCKSKCIYCDFYSRPAVAPRWTALRVALQRELDHKLQNLPPSFADSPLTLYFGGGTPSMMPPEEFRLLSYYIKESMRPLFPNLEISEFTIEVNPDDVTPELSRIWRDCGVNRVSMGVQSLRDEELRVIGRRHSAQRARDAYDTLRRDFDNISLDLMFGLPTQSLESLAETLDGFIDMQPQHISAYSLTYEERTALWRLRDAGKIQEADEELSVEMFELITDRLRRAGYERYEISNYSLPGYRSRHNSAYWRGIPYIGLGPSAHSFDGQSLRTRNLPDTAAYIKYFENISNIRNISNISNIPPASPASYFETERLSREELREEYILTSLRTVEGLSLAHYESAFGAAALRRLLRAARPHLAAATLRLSPASLVLTDSGVMISDEIILSLF